MQHSVFNPGDSLQSAIVELLLRRPSMSVNELIEDLKKEYGLNYTRQHVYKIVGKMVDLGMLHKIKGKLSVDMRWATKVYALFYKSVFDMPKLEEFSIDINLKEGQSKEYVCDSFQAITSVWDNISIRLMETHSKENYQFFSHSYFSLYNTSSKDYCKYLSDKGIHFWTLIGNDTFLDHLGVEAYEKVPNRHATVNTVLPFDRSGYVLEVTGDYIAELKIPPNVEMHFKFMYENIDTIEKFDQQLFTDIFKIKAPFKFVITRNRQDAEKLRYAIRSVL